MKTGQYPKVKAWRAKNPEKVAEQSRRRYAKHKKQINAYTAQWRRDNAERLRPIEAAQARARRAADPVAQRKRMAKFKARQERLLVDIAGRPRARSCELCGTPTRTVFDHCHATGRFRGWLCDRCNRTLGQVKDSVELLRSMIRYLMEGGIGHGPSQLSVTEGTAEEGVRNPEQEDGQESLW